MSTVRCGKCGALVELPKESSLAMGMTIAEDTKGDYVLPMRDSLGRFTKSETTTEYETNNNTTKENETMGNNINMNGFDMETLAKMVAAQLSGQTIQPTENVEHNKIDLTKHTTSIVDGVEDKNGWAKTSQFYGKEICGYAFNPYMIRRFLPSQFEALMKKYNNVVFRGVVKEYPYMYSINYTLEEVRKLAMLQKRDWIAFDERSQVFRLDDCKEIFIKYIKDVLNQFERLEAKIANGNKVGKTIKDSVKGYGWIEIGTVSEKIEYHKVVRYVEKSDDYKRVLADLNDILEKLKNRWMIKTYKDLYNTMTVRPLIKVEADHDKSKTFIDCFIKAGAYYTLKQMLMFDNTVSFRGKVGRDAVVELRRELNNGCIKGYMIYAMLKEVKGIR